MAEIQLPTPRPFSAGAAAVGTFTLDCWDMSETIRTLEGSFALPVQADVLACLSPAD